MADESMVIVDFQALESAITAFTTTAGHIAELSGNLKSNAAAVQSAIASDAANDYVGKLGTLSGNFSRAEERLTGEVQKLKALVDKERMAERTAESIASNVSTFNMQ